MADTKDNRLISSVPKDPNFAVICSFLTNYGTLLGLTDVSFDQLEKWIEDTRYGERRASRTILFEIAHDSILVFQRRLCIFFLYL